MCVINNDILSALTSEVSKLNNSLSVLESNDIQSEIKSTLTRLNDVLDQANIQR